MKKASPNNYNKPFPSTLRKLIEQKNSTITAVADFVGVTRQAVSQYQDGSTQPNAETIVKIAQYFNVSTDYLLGLTPNETTDEATKELCATLGLSDKAIAVLKDDFEKPLEKLKIEPKNFEVYESIFGYNKKTLHNLIVNTINGLLGEYHEFLASEDILGELTEYKKSYPLIVYLARFVEACNIQNDVMFACFDDGCTITTVRDNDYKAYNTDLITTDRQNDYLCISLKDYLMSQAQEDIRRYIQLELNKRNGEARNKLGQTRWKETETGTEIIKRTKLIEDKSNEQ